MKRIFFCRPALCFLGLCIFAISTRAADEYWRIDGTSATWTSSSWGTVPGGPFSTGWTNNNNAVFNANSLITFVTNTQVGNVTVANSSTVTLTAAGTYSTNGNVRTMDVGAGSILDYAAQSFATAAGTGFIKNGDGIWFTANGNAYTGGFTLNAGTIILGGVNAMGQGALTINGGTIAANATRNITTRYTSVTIGGDFTIGAVTTGVSSGNGSAAANITFADNMALGAATRTITIGSNGTYTLSGVLAGSMGTGLTVAASGGATGNLTLGGSSANTYTGLTTVNSGTLILNKTAGVNAIAGNIKIAGGTLQLTTSNQIANTSAIELAGGTLRMNGASEGTTGAAGVGALTLSATSIIDLATTNILHFGASGSQTWSGTLSIYNWNGSLSGGDLLEQLLFGSNDTATSLTQTQLDMISFYSGAGTGFLGTAGFAGLGNGEIVPVPEPSTWVAGALVVVALGWSQRRRFARLVRVAV